MEIIYKQTKTFTEKELGELFLSVNWSSGQYPDKLKVAMENSILSLAYGMAIS